MPLDRAVRLAQEALGAHLAAADQSDAREARHD